MSIIKHVRFRLHQWIFFQEEDLKIISMHFPGTFLVDSKGGERSTVTPIWNWPRVRHLIIRLVNFSRIFGTFVWDEYSKGYVRKGNEYQGQGYPF
jgi:hypothetical protein